jgi:ketosteroid isomerase-like protein
MKFLFFTTIYVSFFAAFVGAQTTQVIEAGFSVEREMGGAQRHFYEVNLTKGQFLNFTVEQRGADVVLKIYAADGKLYDRLDSPNGAQGEEPFRMVSLTGGRFRIELSPWSENLPAGKYFIKPVEIRRATETELKSARLKEELLKIVAEEARAFAGLDVLKRFYLERAFYTSAQGYVLSAAEMIEEQTKNPFKPPPSFSYDVELTNARLEDFGDFALLTVRAASHLVNPPAGIDRTVVQRIGYVFKRANGGWRIAGVQRTYIEREPKRVKLDVEKLDAFVGVYENGKPTDTLTISREGGTLFGKLPGSEEKFELIPESENIFYVGYLSIAFIRDAGGAVSHTVVHYSLPDDRMTIQKKIK